MLHHRRFWLALSSIKNKLHVSPAQRWTFLPVSASERAAERTMASLAWVEWPGANWTCHFPWVRMSWKYPAAWARNSLITSTADDGAWRPEARTSAKPASVARKSSNFPKGMMLASDESFWALAQLARGKRVDIHMLM